jgi:hypothetical protein
MEWKEHVAWLAPMFATSAAVLVAYYGRRLARESRQRRVAVALFMLAFGTAAVAGILGALITKSRPSAQSTPPGAPHSLFLGSRPSGGVRWRAGEAFGPLSDRAQHPLGHHES